MKAFRTLPGGGWRRAVCIVLAAGAIGSVALPGVRLWQDTAAHEWRALGLGTLARARLAAGADRYALQRHEWTAGEFASLPLAAIAADPKIDRTRARILGIAVEACWRGLGAGFAAALAALALIAGWRHSIYRGGKERPPASGGRSAPVPGRMAAPVLAAMPWRIVRTLDEPPPAEARTLPSQTGGSAKKTGEAVRPPASVRPANTRPEAREVPRRKRRRAGRWI